MSLLAKSQSLLFTLYIALSPMVWFSTFTLGPVKRVLLFLIVFLFLRKLVKLPFFILLFISIAFSFLTINTSDFFKYIVGVIENYIMFNVGYCVTKRNFNITKFSFIVSSFITFACVLTITNFFFNIPDWISPDEYRKHEELGLVGLEYNKLWWTGFSWDKNGWGCGLALLFPLSFVRKNDYLKWISICVILFSIFLCGSRNALLVSILALMLYVFFSKELKKARFFVVIGLMFLSLYLISSNELFILEHLKFGNDISAGRFDQYIILPDLFSNMRFGGMGYGNVAQAIGSRIGEYHDFHNAYINTFLQFGVIPGICVIMIAISAIKISLALIKGKSTYDIVIASILLGGLILALFEPSTIFGSLGNFSVWWLIFGYVYKNNQFNRYE